MSPIETITVREVDLEIRVTTPWGAGDQRIDYTVNSPSGVVDCAHRPIHGKALSSPEAFRRRIYAKIEALAQGHELDSGEHLMPEDLQRELEAIGQDLYDQLFPPELQDIYRRHGDRIRSILILSDESWIPWEIVRPYGMPGDDFLCLRFELSRWLVGEAPLVKGLRVRQLLALATATELTEASEEIERLEALIAAVDGVTGTFRRTITFQELTDFLEPSDLDLIHLAGHGQHGDLQAGDSSIRLQDRSFHARHLSGSFRLTAEPHRPFVFFNNCQVGRLGDTLTQVEGWPARWVQRRGCCGFLAPLWSVDDRTARRFAEIFYHHLAAGVPLARAVQAARQQVKEESGDLLTLLAYSLYGHPNAQVLIGNGSAGHPIPPPPPPRPLAPRSTSPTNLAPPQPRVQQPQPSTPRESESTAAPKRSLATVGVLATLLLVLTFWAVDRSLDDDKEPALSGTTQTPSVDGTEPTIDEPAETDTQIAPPPPAKPTWPFPIASPQAGKVVVLVLDETSGLVDHELARAVESVLVNEVPSLAPSAPGIDAKTVKRLIEGDSGVLPGNGKTPWGSQWILVATANRTPLPQSAAHLKSFSLSMQVQVIDASSGSALARNASTQTGIGVSTHQALAQAAERCLDNVLQFLKKETPQ